jgi:hypothetical protein
MITGTVAPLSSVASKSTPTAHISNRKFPSCKDDCIEKLTENLMMSPFSRENGYGTKRNG